MKSARSSAEDERFWMFPCCRDPRAMSHLFGNPAVLSSRTRGFASPDFSGFALSENFLCLNSVEFRLNYITHRSFQPQIIRKLFLTI